MNSTLQIKTNYSRIVTNRLLNKFSRRQKKLNLNYKISQVNINFSQTAFGGKLPPFYATTKLLTYFPKRKHLIYFRKMLYFRSSNFRLFNYFINRTTFTNLNPIYSMSKSLDTLWRDYLTMSNYSMKYDHSSTLLLEKVDEVNESFNKADFIRWRYSGLRSSWSNWRFGLISRQKILNSFISLYCFVGLWTTYMLSQKVFQVKRLENINSLFLLYWTFTKTHRLYLNMRNSIDSSYNYFSLFPGFFLKFYKNRRPLKRTKLFKVLLVRFLRKLLIAGGIKNLNLIVNRSPTIFIELYKLFLTPDIVPYKVPYKTSLYLDSKTNANTSPFFVQKFIFSRTKFYGLYKERRRGRLKRKVARRLIKKNSIMD